MPFFRWLPLNPSASLPASYRVPAHRSTASGPFRFAVSFPLLIHRHLLFRPFQALLPTSGISRSHDKFHSREAVPACVPFPTMRPSFRYQNLICMQDRADPLRDDDHRACRQPFLASARRSAASVFRSSAEKLSSNTKTCGCFAIARAMARRCFLAARTRSLPPCAIGAVVFLCLFSAIKSAACAISAACRASVHRWHHRIAESQVGCDGSGKQHSFLWYKTNLLPKFCHGKLPDINAVHGNDFRPSHHKDAESGSPVVDFTAAGTADDCRRLSRLRNKVNVREHILLRVPGSVKFNMGKLQDHAAVFFNFLRLHLVPRWKTVRADDLINTLRSHCRHAEA